ncbi:carboxylesterase family protein [Trinickia caryophylli]|uniref:Para-nitrobenzyl esterase n=1 Tax=Trinickia caryophylli TaxID=28094 RepID=A0A1X7FB22_TRICW|nr:carboxylesterase family protein [Trinickia caryophylli]PMS10969.1 carboxylesterase family protein [Trinickia caryophylli]TRX18918.1 carboxylesterase family protein [Trinickia caryophylli]WQE10283.1 carboxylesterase family protein [Trinickia caryophylli]SMF48805.1 para-nitrobenzyl esterase [Trinickia caryophylli]GLU34270.1 carboxylic ester hydrolase [Trinickia caryophylli]
MHPFVTTRSMRTALATLAISIPALLPGVARAAERPPAQVQLPQGAIQGARETVGTQSLHVFRGIPYAAPPTGALRWREPQPTARWPGIWLATKFAPRCMQSSVHKGTFRSGRMSEDCLYLNVWAPATGTAAQPLPVLVYFHGGEFRWGDGTEPRYDGGNLAARGMVVVTVNYRLGVFGFLAHQEAARESPHGSSGNYGLLDQQAALRWVQENVARFGGDPARVTIAGDAAGSISVSAHMASPSSRGLFARAAGFSAGAFGLSSFWNRDKAEAVSHAFAEHVGAGSLRALRSISADKLLATAEPKGRPKFAFWPNVDGHFLTDSPESVFATGAQARVPLLAGSNSQEAHYVDVLGEGPPLPNRWKLAIRRLFPDNEAEALSLYPASNEWEVMKSATALASDLHAAHTTRRWVDLHRQTGTAPVYYYLFARRLPLPTDGLPDETRPTVGAAHRAQIPYVLDTLAHERSHGWTYQDIAVSRVFSGYLAQFVKTGDPNEPPNTPGNGPSPQGEPTQSLPTWPAARAERDGLLRQLIDVDTQTITDVDGTRHAFIDRVTQAPSNRAHPQ